MVVAATETVTVHPFDEAIRVGRPSYKVSNLELAEFGRNEIRLAEQEMPGLMTLRREYSGKVPLAAAKIMGRLLMTVQKKLVKY